MLTHQIDTGYGLGHRMFHLQPGVHLQEKELISIEQKLDCARRVVANGAGCSYCGSAHAFTQRLTHRRRRRFLDDFLMTTLNRAFALEAVHHIAVAVTQHLDFHMPCLLQPALQEHRTITKCSTRFPLSRLDGGAQLRLFPNNTHALATTASGGFDQQRISDRLSDCFNTAIFGELGRRQLRHSRISHQALGAQFVTHGTNCVGRRTDPDEACIDNRSRKLRVLSQKPIAWMHRIRTTRSCRLQQLVHAQVSLERSRTAQGNCQVGFLDERFVDIWIGVHGDCSYAHRMGAKLHTPGNLTAIGNQQVVYRLTHVRVTSATHRNHGRPRSVPSDKQTGTDPQPCVYPVGQSCRRRKPARSRTSPVNVARPNARR